MVRFFRHLVGTFVVFAATGMIARGQQAALRAAPGGESPFGDSALTSTSATTHGPGPWNGEFEAQVMGTEAFPMESWYGDAIPRGSARGRPLVGTSWRNRPLHVGWLFGGLYGESLVTDEIDQDEDLLGGYRVGYDFSHSWGTELRFAFSNLDFVDASDTTLDRTAKNHFADINLVYYPWGDSAWRPFLSAGIGASRFQFTPADNQEIDETLLLLPLGGGLKYYFRNWMALRCTVVDNLSVGSGSVDTMHQLSLTADIEMRFGGSRPSYYPYGGATHGW